MDRGLEHLSSRADATENTAAIRAVESRFRPVGLMREYRRPPG
jgi:hypothetical protein